MSAIRVTVLGASNSILKNGYVPRLAPALYKQGIDAHINNVSIGASYCLRGLSSVISGEAEGSDIYILEFSVTDTPYLAKVGIETWLMSYEALVRSIYFQSPEASIIALILGRADKTVFKWQRVMRREIKLLAKKYGFSVVDFDKQLHNLLPSFEEFKEMYTDKLHYAAPLAPSLCATAIAKKIRAITEKERSEPHNTALSERHVLDGAKVLNFVDYEKVDNLPKENFENSRYKVDVVKLAVGEKINLPDGIKPLGVEFVSTINSSSMGVERDGKDTHIHTFHKGLSEKRFNFLIRFSHLQDVWSDGAECFAKSLYATKAPDSLPTVPKSGMIFNDQGNAIYLKSLIYI